MNLPSIDRYPGARPFADDINDRQLFFGRDEEIDTLFYRVCASRLLVLFGKSGLGKTSLLQAGVFPKLRERNNLPIPVRFNLPESPLALIKAAAEACQRQNPDIVYTEGTGETLWEFFKTAMFWQGDVLLTPVLVFDQFEEIFTLKTAEQRSKLAGELGDLFRGALPHSVRQQRQAARSEDDSGVTGGLSEQPPNMRVILSLREDYLGALQELAADIPAIFDDRIRLSPLTKEQALRAICAPAALAQDAAVNGRFKSPPFDYAADALTEMIDFLRGKSDVIEPFQLQLVCRHIEEQLVRDKLSTITRNELGGRKRLETIVSNFYRQTLAKLPKRERKQVRRLCEEGLLSAEGFRLTLQEQQIFTGYRLSPASLDALVEARLLRKEPRLESYFYELSHDSLARPILDSRPLKLTRKQRNILWGGLAFMLLLGGFAYLQVQAKQQARAAQQRAQQAREAAEEVLEYLVFDLRDKLDPIGRLDIVEGIQKRVDRYYETVGIAGQSAEVLNRRAAAHESAGDRLLAQGQLEKAWQAYQQSFALVQQAAKLEPDDLDWQRSLSVPLGKLGNVLMAQGKRVEAQQYYQDSLAIRQKLAMQDPGNTEWQRDVLVSLNKLGDVLMVQGKREEAQQYYQDSLAISRKLSEQDPGNTGWQRDLSVSLNNLGYVLMAQGKRVEAQQYYQEDLVISRKLAIQDPGNAGWQRNLSVSLNNLGDVLNVQGKLEDAQQRYQDNLAISRKLAEQDPGNAGWQRDVSVSLNKLGDVLNAQGKREEALQHYRDSLAISRKLAALDPSNATWQSDLVRVYGKSASVLVELNRFDEAAEMAQHKITQLLNQADSPAKNEALAGAYMELAWYELFNRQFSNAIEASEKGLQLNIDESDNLMLTTNLAHGYLFSGQYQKAKPLYLDNKDKKLADGRSFKQAVLDDFKEFRQHGLQHPDIKRIESALN